jgi:hypothetical protein
MGLTRLPTPEPILEELCARKPLPPLCPAHVYNRDLTAKIDALPFHANVKAGLHLMNDDWKRAHDLVEPLDPDQTANYWHAIVHRREGDFWNSKWWFRKIQHPLLKTVYGNDSNRGAQAFVDQVERADSVSRLEEKQLNEMRLLMDYAFKEYAQ